MLCLFETKLTFEEVNFSIEEELEFFLTKRFDLESHIKGYHVYINEWTPEIGEFFKTRLEPEYVVDRFEVEILQEGQIVELLNKQNSGRLTKSTLCFLRANPGNACQVEIRNSK